MLERPSLKTIDGPPANRVTGTRSISKIKENSK
jgi:hypothetical protein